jgi:hypothetical protein
MKNWRLYCFADEASGKWQGTGCLAPDGEYKRILDLGPLSVPEILRN